MMQTSVFQITTTLLNSKLFNICFSENVNIPKSKFEQEIFELFISF